ncbi:MAG: type I glyceraldehyde-3-phosphate dehydrogenase [Candidatus Yanofskybacteria bacterium RIFCSPLOWO2_01_FULL_49_25]|uniref:Type I glyceraldehyde-3-phosphate dehydrogenase n=1 Tax=Candidatus Yanofskybacteria bacterium RIFCSPLOWO2_01_FULL_49_25 TaxID=1802701 RepID=A0A1F8GWZ9_9BACT|nr:MAG: type I glyceraldehyde-3-phosphate dehydrogenase [Candidatus Yanofskybacteria bacterium RIFCSPLOWO2_01_FULL_49_25]
MTKIAINGFGRIGRIFFRQAFAHPELEIVAINDLGLPENLAYLLKYDTVYKTYDKNVEVKDGHLVVDGKVVQVTQEKDPTKLPWGTLGVDVVIESTGVFETAEKAQAHITAGAKRVVISAPAKDDVTPTATPNVGIQTLSSAKITSNASCTTNCVNPVVAIIMNSIGIKKAMLNTVHGYTATQMLVDGPGGKDFRRGRAAAQNIVPSTTGAAKATTRIITELEGKFDGIAIRVPVPAGSLIDLTFLASRPTTVEEVNDIFRKACASPEWNQIIAFNEDQIVSSDILGNPHGSIFDSTLTKVVDGDLVKIFSWYDNEWGYTGMLVKHVQEVAKLL